MGEGVARSVQGEIIAAQGGSGGDTGWKRGWPRLATGVTQGKTARLPGARRARTGQSAGSAGWEGSFPGSVMSSSSARTTWGGVGQWMS